MIKRSSQFPAGQRCEKNGKSKEEVPCPDVIKKYNAKMGWVDKNAYSSLQDCNEG